MQFPLHFICASYDCADFDHPVPAPYLRRKFTLDTVPEKAEILVSGLGFYRLFLNGRELTKGPLAPYISAPDDLVYYDRYDVAEALLPGENVVGLLLGNGMQNCFGGYVWDFDKARWRGAPMAALRLYEPDEGEGRTILETDSSFVTHPSPVLFNELRCGEYYDARLEIPGWCSPGFDDRDWTPALPAMPPRGELRLCGAEPIVISETRKPVSIQPYQDGYLYDFGINTAGRCRLHVNGRAGQEIFTFHGEWLHNGVLEQSNINFGDRGDPRAKFVQCNRYFCKDGEQDYVPYFAYYGFQYVYVRGITPEQAVPELLTMEVMHSGLAECGNFHCSDETANLLQLFTRRSTLANFYYFPTDCPHREKNGWTGDAALSAEHTLLNLHAEESYREWLRSIRAAQDGEGSLPGIVPTGGWGYHIGPAWDCVLTYLPYYVWKFRGDLEIVKENVSAIFRHLYYLTTRRDKNGLIAYGLGDWCPPGRGADQYKSPLPLTDSIISMDTARKAAVLFRAAGLTMQAEFAENLADSLRAAIRKHLIDFSTMTAAGACQTSQAMAIYYDIFEPGEKPAAFTRLLELISDFGDHLDTGILGIRVMFHVLSDFGEEDLAWKMITRPDYPSYGNWVARGATSLWEFFHPEGGEVNSMNHHFFGDISSWFIGDVAGIRLNPGDEDCNALEIRPHFVKALTFAEAYHDAPAGKIKVRWERNPEGILLSVEIPTGMSGQILPPKGWVFENDCAFRPAVSGSYQLKKAGTV